MKLAMGFCVGVVLVGVAFCCGGVGSVAPTAVPPPATITVWFDMGGTYYYVGETYYLPFGSSLCELPGDASLDWLDPQYCEGEWLDLYPKEVILAEIRGEWCRGVGEYRSLDGASRSQEGWVACRFLSTEEQE